MSAIDRVDVTRLPIRPRERLATSWKELFIHGTHLRNGETTAAQSGQKGENEAGGRTLPLLFGHAALFSAEYRGTMLKCSVDLHPFVPNRTKGAKYFPSKNVMKYY